MSAPPPWVKKAMAKKAGGKSAPYQRRCYHCYVWAPAESEGVVLIRCAHCPEVVKKFTLALVDQDWIARSCASTRAAHARICQRPAR